MLAIRAPPEGHDMPLYRAAGVPPRTFAADRFKAHELLIRTRFGTQVRVLVQIHSVNDADGDSLLETYTLMPLDDAAATDNETAHARRE